MFDFLEIEDEIPLSDEDVELAMALAPIPYDDGEAQE